jgi:glutamyl-tRNA synthetase
MKDGSGELLEASLEALRGVDPFEVEPLEQALNGVVESTGAKPGKVFQPIRVAITGTSISPGIFESLAVLGRERSIERIERALARTKNS